MMNNILFRWLLLIALFFLQEIYASSNSKIKLDCNRLKIGLFFYEPVPGLLVIIERKPEEQIQHRLYRKLYKREAISWIGPCSYRIQTTEKNDPILQSEDTAPTLIQILNIFVDHYEYKEFKNNVWGETQKMFFLSDLSKAIDYQIQHQKEE